MKSGFTDASSSLLARRQDPILLLESRSPFALRLLGRLRVVMTTKEETSFESMRMLHPANLLSVKDKLVEDKRLRDLRMSLDHYWIRLSKEVRERRV